MKIISFGIRRLPRKGGFARAAAARPATGAGVSDAPPPRRGPNLGLRLGLLITSIVVGVMAALTGTQLILDLRAELGERQALLSASLSPVVAELRAASTRADAQAAVARFHSSYQDRGHAHHNLAVLDSIGRVLVTTGARGAEPPLLTSSAPLVSPAFGSEEVKLVVTQDSTDLAADRSRRWRAWAAHIGLTALLILALLFVVIRREITGPIDRLLRGVRKMELGYWDGMPDPGGAWEVRWLGWRFRALGQELGVTAERLVAAQRRAYAADGEAHTDFHRSAIQPHLNALPSSGSSSEPFERVIVLTRLQTRLQRLRVAEPGDDEVRALAQITWDRDAEHAERLGQPGLRMSLEDAALRVLEPVQYREIKDQLQAQRPKLDALVEACNAEIGDALNLRAVSYVEISHRIKHPAGIWKKMREKDLTFDQVHDLIALRIVVPTEADCYHALGVVHDIYAPLVGRFKDYIAQPKPNGYRSVHTSVRASNGSIFEVQIRSIAMHQHAEFGGAGHAEYKHATWNPVSAPVEF